MDTKNVIAAISLTAAVIILYEPQLDENIGAVARAMLNFKGGLWRESRDCIGKSRTNV